MAKPYQVKQVVAAIDKMTAAAMADEANENDTNDDEGENDDEG